MVADCLLSLHQDEAILSCHLVMVMMVTLGQQVLHQDEEEEMVV
jgi:hypothetical protein